MEYGRFSDDGREYIIFRPDTPRPWINYLTNGRYCALISHTGGGYSFHQSSGYNRLTRAHPAQMNVTDQPGRYLYLRDGETDEFWTVNWQPVRRALTRWEARHAPGWTRISCSHRDVEAVVTYFVPLDDDVELWRVTLRNHSDQRRRLGIFGFVEWCLGSYAFDLLENSFANLFNELAFRDEVILATKRLWEAGRRPSKPLAGWDRWTFFAMSEPVTSYDVLRDHFLGGGGLEAPAAVVRGRCSNVVASGRDAVAVLHAELEMDPAQDREVTFVLGVAPDPEEAISRAARYRDRGEVERAWQHLCSYWDRYLGRLWVQTPDEDMNLAVNIWNKYQAWVTAWWARMASYYVGGGSIAGFRDTCQDILGILPLEPDRARRTLLELHRHQFADGGCLHNWDPVTDRGPRTGHSDDPLWLVLGTVAYLNETGDMTLLDERVPFYDQGDGSVWEHLMRAVDFTLSRFSARGLPLMGAGDWNDGLNCVGEAGRGESIMVAAHLCWTLRDLAPLAQLRGDDRTAHRCRRMAADIAKKVNELCWTGEWYLRAFTDDGEPVGHPSCREGKIYLNAQTWAVLSGIATRERALAAMDSCHRHLDTPYGPALFLPAYRQPDDRLGIISRFAPGCKENGTIFNHTVAWAVIAECTLKRPEHAYKWWRNSSFVVRGRDVASYQAEPYVYAEYVHGPDSPFFGRGEFTWTTGTAAWMWRACLDWILGVRPELEGLRIAPCIPPSWAGYEMTRPFRGADYLIRVKNQGSGCSVREVKVNGKSLSDNLVPPQPGAGPHLVEVVLA